jgi:hypothetical protein
MLRLFTLFISYRFGGHYCGVYPSLEHLYGVIEEMVEDMEIDKKEIPDIRSIESALEGNDDYWHEFSDSTWIHVQETSEQLVKLIACEEPKKLSLMRKVYDAVYDNTETFSRPPAVDEQYPPDNTPAGVTLAYLLGAIAKDGTVDMISSPGQDYQFLKILREGAGIGEIWKYITLAGLNKDNMEKATNTKKERRKKTHA